MMILRLDWFSPFNTLSAYCVAEVELYQRREPIYFALGLPNWRLAERVNQLVAIYQIKDLSKFSLVTTK